MKLMLVEMLLILCCAIILQHLVHSTCSLICHFLSSLFYAMVTQVGSLLKTVKNVEDEAACGIHSLESSIDGIELELKVYMHIRIHRKSVPFLKY